MNPRQQENDSRTFPSPSTTTCGLPFCRLNPCQLSTHRAYMQSFTSSSPILPSSSSPISTEADDVVASTDPRLIPPWYLIEHSAKYIDRYFTDGLPALPFETSHVNRFRDLLNHFFTDQVHRITRIFSPHLDSDARARNALESIYSNPVVMVVLLSNSQTDRLLMARGSSSDRTTEVVYGVTLRMLREHIDSFRPSDTRWLLMMVVALTGLAFCMNKMDELDAHRAAITKLVTMLGGPESMGPEKSFVMNTDRFIALCLAEYPLYRTSIRSIQPAPPLGMYGASFAKLTEVLDQPVIEFAQNQCRLIHLLELRNVDLSIKTGKHTPQFTNSDSLPYFLYTRDKIAAEHAQLHAEYHDKRIDPTDPTTLTKSLSISRCVILGSHIHFYTVGFGDYYTVVRPMLAAELEDVIKCKPRADWHGQEDLIIWLLFVLAMVPKWDSHSWAIAELRLWLSMKFTDSWPNDSWSVEQLPLLRNFVWSNRAYNDSYKDICEEVLELEAGLTALQKARILEETADDSSSSSSSDESVRPRVSKSHSANDADDETSHSPALQS